MEAGTVETGTTEPGVKRGRAAFRVVVGVGVLAVLAVLVLEADVRPESVLGILSGMDPLLVALSLAAALAAQLCWAAATAQVLGQVAPAGADGRIGLGYLSGTFAKQVLPFGHAGGVPLLTVILAEELGVDYRTTFGAVTASELVIFLSSLVVAALGAVLFVLTRPGAFATVGVALLAVVVLAVAGGLIGRRLFTRSLVERLALVLAALGRVTLGKVFPAARARLSPEAVERSLFGVTATVRRVTRDRRVLRRTVGFGALGWVLFGLPLFLAFRAVGAPVPLALALFLVPVGGVATLLPTPGGLGGTEVGLTAAVVLLTGLATDVATAGVLAYRLATYWFVVAVGGGAAVVLSLGGLNPRS